VTVQQFFGLIIRNIVILFLLVGLGLYAAVDQTSKMTPLYKGTATIFVATPPELGGVAGPSKIGELSSGNTFSQARVKSYASIVNNPVTLAGLKKDYEVKYSVQELVGKISAKEIPGTVLIEITAVDPSPALAAGLANWVALEFANTVGELELDTTLENINLIKVNLIKSAVIDTNPVSPRKFFNYFVGIFIGALLGFIYLLIRLSLDKKVKNQSDLDGIRLLGSIPFDKNAVKNPLLVSSDSYSPRTEAYRSLRAAVVHALSENKVKSVVITSCKPGDGKSTGALNLGYSLSTAGIKVLVVEADLRRPSFNSHLESLRVEDLGHRSAEVGLSELLNPKSANLTSKTIQNAIVHTTFENLHILPCRGVPDNPAELLEGPRMPFLIQALEEQYNLVIYDSPPALSVVDSLVLGRLIKQVFLIVHAGSTSKHSFITVKEAFQEVQSELTGVILNKVPKRKIGDEYGYSYYGYKHYRYSHSYKPDKVKPGKRGTLLSAESTAPVLIPATEEKEQSESSGNSVAARKEIISIRGVVKRLDS